MNPQSCDTCICGKTFVHRNAFTHHQRFCRPSRKRVADSLAAARVAWEEKRERKRQRQAAESETSFTTLGSENTACQTIPAAVGEESATFTRDSAAVGKEPATLVSNSAKGLQVPSLTEATG